MIKTTISRTSAKKRSTLVEEMAVATIMVAITIMTIMEEGITTEAATMTTISQLQ